MTTEQVLAVLLIASGMGNILMFFLWRETVQHRATLIQYASMLSKELKRGDSDDDA